MSEITKLYENAGIKKVKDYYCPNCETKLEDWFGKHKEYICPNERCDYALCDDEEDFQECLEHLSYREKYPPFTAEKQRLLFQLLARIESADYFQFFFYEIKQEWVFRLNMLTELSCECAYFYENRNKKFDECLASLINTIWQDLTSEQKQQVKGILE